MNRRIGIAAVSILALIVVASALYAVPALAYMNGTATHAKQQIKDGQSCGNCSCDCQCSQNQTRTQEQFRQCNQNETCALGGEQHQFRNRFGQ